MAKHLIAVAATLAWTVAFVGATKTPVPAAFSWDVPPGFALPRVPADNPMIAEKVALGRFLFYDARLSANGTQACASCHEQSRAFTDGRRTAIGSTGEAGRRNSMSLANAGYTSVLTWANPRLTRLEDQALIPLFGHDPTELGWGARGDELLARLRGEPVYARAFPTAFAGEDEPFTIPNVTRALAAFERTLISGRSPYDRYHFERDDSAVSAAARRGETLFFSSSLSCFRCHEGFTLSGAADFEGRRARMPELFNTALYNVPGALGYPSVDTGLYELTHDVHDAGKFKATTLRNIAVTAPYMHDGSIATLGEVIDHYAKGGNGRDNPHKSEIIKGFAVTPDEKADLIAFLNTLTDSEFLRDPRFANPWSAHDDAR